MRNSCENCAKTVRKPFEIFRQTDRQTLKGMANWALDEVRLCENYAKTLRKLCEHFCLVLLGFGCNLKENLYAPQSCLGPMDSGPRGACLDPRDTSQSKSRSAYAKPMRKPCENLSLRWPLGFGWICFTWFWLVLISANNSQYERFWLFSRVLCENYAK